jgi:hypothetical protein
VTGIEIRPIDQRRAGRVLLATSAGDMSGVMLAAKEAVGDGTVFVLLLALARFGIEITKAFAPDGDADRLITRALLDLSDEQDGDTEAGRHE